MSAFEDISGRKFGLLTALKYLGRENNNSFWECLCDCGVVCKKRSSHLKSGASGSCGCYNRMLLKTKFKTHGLSKHPLNSIHNAMMQRCYNKNQKAYKYYGGRGIIVCERWHTFKNFYDDMFDGYKAGLSIERDNVNGNYELSNCRWVTANEQYKNRTDSVFIDYNGERMIMKDWAKKLGIKNATLWARLNWGWPVERAFTEAVKLGRR